jgi:MinD superfamily P-loop ATPase
LRCSLDTADLHLIIEPTIQSRHDFQSGRTALIDENRCSQCGQCRDLCQFEAINLDFQVAPVACEGCGVCVPFCPENAIDFPLNTYAINSHVATLGRIPFDTAMTRVMVQARTILEYDPASETSRAIQDLWQKVSDRVLFQL